MHTPTRIVRLALLPVTAYLALLLAMSCAQRSLLYFPRRAPAEELEREATAFGLRPWRDADGGWIGWRQADPAPRARRVLVFHGNGGNAVDRAHFAHVLRQHSRERPWEIAILEYPGYGARPGRPSQANFHAAALAALDALRAERAEPIWLIGESLGSGVACQLAAARPAQVAGLLLITPFTALSDVAQVHYPFAPTRWLLRDRYESAAALRHYRGPLVVLVAGEDEIVPARFGLELYARYDGPKRLFVQPERGHNALDLSPAANWWREALAFLAGDAAGTAPDGPSPPPTPPPGATSDPARRAARPPAG